MAEQTGLRNNALPYPIYGQPFGVTFPLLDADGDPISPSSPDSEVSKNGDTFADCTNEATEIATSSGICYLLLTATEMTSDVVTVRVQSTGAKTTVITLYPRKLVTLRAGTAAGGAAGSITLDSGALAVDDFYNGCVVAGVLDSTNEVRVITDYVGSTKVASVTPNWNTTPDSDDTFTVYLPEGRQIDESNVKLWNGTAVPSEHTAGYPIVTIKDGTGTGEINTNAGAVALVDLVTLTTTTTTATNVTTVNGLAANVITAASIATGAIDADAIADNAIDAGAIADAAIDAATFAAGAITATVIATGAIDADAIAADAVTEIQSGLATAAALATVDGIVDDILLDTAEIGTAGAGLTNINLPNQTMDIVGNITGNLSGSVGSVTGAVGSVTGAVGSVTAAVTVGTNNDKTGYALSATGSAALTEDYAADGATATLNQLLYMIYSTVMEFAIAGTTLTCKKLDGSTTAMTVTLNDATNPTSRTRSG